MAALPAGPRGNPLEQQITCLQPDLWNNWGLPGHLNKRDRFGEGMSTARTGCSQITPFPVSTIHIPCAGRAAAGVWVLISMWEKAGRAEQDARGSRGDPAASAQQIPGLGHHGGQEWGDRERVTAGTGHVWRGAPVGTQTQRAGLCIGVYLSH